MAYTGNSIVDFLSQSGQASDYNSRAKLAASKGITGYTGSAQQNTSLLNILRGSAQPSQPSQPSAPSAPTIQAPGSSGSSFEDTLARAMELTKQANQPIISNLQNSIGGIKSSYEAQNKNLEAQRKPLQDRYDQLLATVKGNQQVAENRQTLTTNNELGKRGLLPSSGLAQQEVTNAVNPITQQYTALGNDVGFQGQQAQQDITNQEVGLSSQQIKDLQNVNDLIAQAQSGGNKDAISLAMSQQEQQRQAQQQAIQNLLAQQQLGISSAAQKVSASSAASENALRNAQIQQMDPSYIANLYKTLGIGQPTTSAPPGQVDANGNPVTNAMNSVYNNNFSDSGSGKIDWSKYIK